MQYAFYNSSAFETYTPVESAVFPMQINAGTIQTKVIGGTEYQYVSVTTNNVDYAQITDKTELYSNSPSNPQPEMDKTYYIKPDRTIKVKCTASGASSVKVVVSADVGAENLGGGLINHTSSAGSYISIHVGEFNIRGTKFTGVYMRQGDRQLYIAGYSEKFWNGAARPETKSETKTASPSGHWGTGHTTKGNQDFVHYAQALNVVNTGAHGLRMYDVGTSAIDAIYERLWSRDIWDVWANRKFNPIGGLLSLHRVPCAAPTGAAVSSVTIAGQQYPVPTNSAKLVSDNIVTVECNGGNWLDVPEIAGSFVDYAPYCSAVLTLPFVGSVGIDVNAFSSGKIKVVYEIDLISGNCLAEVFTLDRDGSSILYGSYAGNCAYKMPITGNDNGGLAVLGAVAGIATTGLATVATGGSAAPLAASVISGAANAIGAEHHLQQAGTLPSNASAIGDLRVTLVITRPAYLTPDDYEQIKGYPAGDGHTISQYSGFLAGEMHAEGIDGATDAEKAAIEAAFAGGVYV